MFNDDKTEDGGATELAAEFATCGGKLYWIAYVLVGDAKTAERAVLASVEITADPHTAFGNWLCDWAIRSVIQACVRLCKGELIKEQGSKERWLAKVTEGVNIKLQISPLSQSELQQALLRLSLFLRFVFVARVEGYSLQDVSALLNVDEESCEAGLAYSLRAVTEALLPAQPVGATMIANAARCNHRSFACSPYTPPPY